MNRVNPKYSSIQVGEPLRIYCDNQIPGVPSQWIFNGGYIAGYARTVLNVLLIKNVWFHHSGVYTCYGGIDRYGRFEMFISSSTIKVLGWYTINK